MMRLRIPQKIILATLLAFFPTYFIPYLHIDEGNWAAMTQVLFSGEFYKLWSDNKPPFLLEWFWLISGGGRSMLAVHLLSALWWGVGALSFRRILLQFFSAELSFWGAAIMGILGATLNYGAFSAELALTPFLLLAVEIAFNQASSTSRSRMKFGAAPAAGFLVGLACNIKPTAVIFGFFVCLIFLRAPRSWLLAPFGVVGGLLATAITWALVNVPFKTIFHEAIEINFQYVQFNNHQSIEALKDVVANLGVALGVAYLAVSLGTLIAMSLGIQKILKSKKWSRDQVWNFGLGIALLFLTYKTVSMGQRYFQQYFVTIIPSLVFFSVYSLSQKKNLKLGLSLIAVASLIIFQIKIIYLQMTDQNKNWNSKIQHLIQEIRRDTQAGDPIWISNALGMVYHQTERPPAVKYYFFLHLIKFAETCRADESEMKEDLSNSIYKESIDRVLFSPPKVIFWATRHEHSCSDRIKVENFPTVEKLLSEKYELVSTNELGKYYRLKRNLNLEVQ